MSSEPAESAIDEFVAITNATRDQAVAFLKANNLDSNRAIDRYFENPSGPGPAPEQWTGTASTQQEAYGYQSQTFPSAFDTDSSDNALYGAAPSRPPSRIAPRERQEGVNIAEAVEKSAEPAPNKPHKMTAAEREEHEMRQALAMSLGGNPDHFGQETGVVSLDGPKFGPANRDHYDPHSWALMPFASSREVCVDPDPEERKRVDGEPTFLRPTDEDQDYLGGLVTILHAIPLARETFLHRDRIAADYGYDSQWWNGRPINLPGPPSETVDAETSQSYIKDNVLLETQRLMAFLDNTKRAFGSAEPLAGLRTIGSWGAEQRIARFLRSWEPTDAVENHENKPTGIFSNRAVKKSEATEEQLNDDTTFMVADITLGFDQAETLYDVIDTNLWADFQGVELDDVWLDRVADVFTIRLDASGMNSPVGIKIPAVWYPDRYMDSFKEYSRELRKRRLETDAEVERLQTLVYQISDGAGATDGVTAFKGAMEKAIAGSLVALRNRQPNGSVSNGQEQSGPNVEQLASKLRAIGEQVEQKLQGLEKQKAEAIESLKEFSRRLTGPSSSPEDPPHHKYTLRGVCTRPHVTYVLRRRENRPESTDNAEDADDWQWWRISFSADDAAARLAEANKQPAVQSSIEGQSSVAQDIKKRRFSVPGNTDVVGHSIRQVREIEVLRAAREESSTVLLVYANDAAVNFGESAIPESLQAFVDTDNEAFQQELHNANLRQEEEEMGKENNPPNLPDPHTSQQDTEMSDRGRPVSRDGTEADIVNNPSGTRGAVTEPSVEQSGARVEMQERSGPGLLASTRHRSAAAVPSPDPMQLIQEEDGNGNDGAETRINPAA